MSGGALHMHGVNFSSRVPLSLIQRRHPLCCKPVSLPRHLRAFCQKLWLIAVRHAHSAISLMNLQHTHACVCMCMYMSCTTNDVAPASMTSSSSSSPSTSPSSRDEANGESFQCSRQPINSGPLIRGDSCMWH